MDKMIWEHKEYELAKNTMKIARKIEAAEQAETVMSAYAAELDLVMEALGEEVASEILGTTDIESVDLGTLVLVYTKIIEGYEKRIADMRTEQDSKIFNAPGFRAIGKVADDVKVIQSVDKMKR